MGRSISIAIPLVGLLFHKQRKIVHSSTPLICSDLYGLGLFLYYLFAFVTIFWSTYGFGTFAAALVLGVYLSWAIFYKLASHLHL